MTLLITIEGQKYTFRQIAARLDVKPNSANARLRRLQRVLRTQNVTWEQLERGSRGYVYRVKLPKQFECRNELRRMLSDRGLSFQWVAKQIKSTRQHVERVLGTPTKKNRYALTPEFVNRVCKALGLDEDQTGMINEMGARENGWKI